MRTHTSQTKNLPRRSKPYSRLERPIIDIMINKLSKIESRLLAQVHIIQWTQWPNIIVQHFQWARTQLLDSSSRNCKVLTKSSTFNQKISGLVQSKESSPKLLLLSRAITKFQELEHTAQTKSLSNPRLLRLESEWTVLIGWFSINNFLRKHRTICCLMLASLRRKTRRTWP